MFRKRSRLISAKSRELLLSDENYITLIFAVIIFAFAIILPFIAYYMAYGAADGVLIFALFIFIELFVSVPILFGSFRIAGLASKKADMGIVDVFFAFCSIKNYFRAIILSFIHIFKIITPLSIGYILAYAVINIFNIPNEWSTWVTVAGLAASFVLFLPLILRFYAVDLLVTADDEGVINAIRLSWGYTRKNIAFLLKYSLKMLPLLIVSIVAVCVPLLVYTLPFLFCAYAIVCRKLILPQKQNDICPEDLSEGVEEINEQDS